MSLQVSVKPEAGSPVHLNAAGLNCCQRKLVRDCLQFYTVVNPVNFQDYSAVVDGIVEVLRTGNLLTSEVEAELRARCKTKWLGDRPQIKRGRQ